MPRMPWEKGTELLVEFLKRVAEVNGNAHYPFSVGTVVVYGSYVRRESTIGDLDVAYGLEIRTEDHDEFDRLCRERVRLAVEKGRTFRSSTDKLFWRREEVGLHLKGRTRGLDLQEFPDLLHMEKDSGFAYIVLMGDAEAIATEVGQPPLTLEEMLSGSEQTRTSARASRH